jgi:hypothetical protein
MTVDFMQDDRFEVTLEVPPPPVDAFMGRHPFLCAYQPMKAPFDNARDQYMVNVPYGVLPPKLQGQVYRPRTMWRESNPYYEGLWVGMRSNVPPEVVPLTEELLQMEGDVVSFRDLTDAQDRAADRLAAILRRLEARNLSRDRVFDRRPLRVTTVGLRYGSDEGIRMSAPPRDIAARLDGTFKLIPTKVWVYLED